MWTTDKFINLGHAAAVAAKFYGLPAELGAPAFYLLGALQLAFVAGFKKRLSYGAILLMHGISTLSSYAVYFDPWGPRNLLFFAVWPMLAACIALYLLRDSDRLLTVE